MPRVDWFPCRIEPLTFFGFNRCEVLPGVTISRMSKSETRRLAELREGYRDVYPMSDSPNLLISVDQDKYLPFLIERVTSEGFDIAKDIAQIPKEWRDHVLLTSYEPVRHLLTSMALLKPFRLTTPSGKYSFDKITIGKAARLRPSSFSPFRPYQESSALLGYRPYRKSAPPVSGRELRKIVDALEPYYRPAYWRSDRLTVALSNFWSFLFSPFPEHSFLSLVVILEALVSTSNTEVTHQISERSAVLLEGSPDGRLAIYKKIKTLYSVRSQIVHGSMVKKITHQVIQGSMIPTNIARETSYVNAQKSIISVSRYCEIAELSVRMILAVLNEPALMAAVKSGKTKQIDDFYLHRLFS